MIWIGEPHYMNKLARILSATLPNSHISSISTAVISLDYNGNKLYFFYDDSNKIVSTALSDIKISDKRIESGFVTYFTHNLGHPNFVTQFKKDIDDLCRSIQSTAQQLNSCCGKSNTPENSKSGDNQTP